MAVDTKTLTRQRFPQDDFRQSVYNSFWAQPGLFGEYVIMNAHITVKADVCHGQACVRDTRIPVHQIVHMLANGDTIEDLLDEYPSLTRDDVLACLDYAASLTEEQITPIS